MGDPTSRRNQTRNRLRAQLRKKRESLADQFDFKIYIAFVFKEKVSSVLLKDLLLGLFKCAIHILIGSNHLITLNIYHRILLFLLPTEKEVCTFWGGWSGASDDKQLWRKHPQGCAGFQLLPRKLYRTPAKGRCAVACPQIPVNAQGKNNNKR